MAEAQTSGRRAVWRGAALAFLLDAVMLGAAIWATRLNMSGAAAALPQPTALPPTPAGRDAQIQLPAFQVTSKAGELARLANLQTLIPNRPRVSILRYSVQSGDSVFGIAKKFGLAPETILWGNFDTLNDDPHLLKPGQDLNILPVDGAYYQWKENDTLEGVADLFGVEPSAIVDWPGNNLSPIDPQIETDSWLIIPGGKRPFRQWLVPTIARGSTGTGTAAGPGGCTGGYGGVVGTGGFIWPTQQHSLSGNDYWSGHLAIDIAAGIGDPVWAADSGVIVFAGWANGGYGNTIMIDHGNGWQTLYAHLSSISAACGQSVPQGQRIGSAGSTGNSTGAHLHFETRYQGGFVNPWYVLP